MKKIGKEVLFLKTGEGNPRNGEGAFIRLKDGRILYAYTEYYGVSWLDHAIARISGCFSSDEGESWSTPIHLIEKEERAENIMSVSLLRLPDDRIMIVYLRKTKREDGGILCMPVFRYSEDECATFSEAHDLPLPKGYYVLINDGVIITDGGRIYLPLSHHCDVYFDGKERSKAATVRIAYSDDLGATFNFLPHEFRSPYDDTVGLAEPGIYAHEDGSLWMWCRTVYGFQYHSISYDGGQSWSSLEPNYRFTSPDSPMRVKKVDGRAIAVFNPYGYSCLRSGREAWGSPKRTPFVCAISGDDAHSFSSLGKPAFTGGLLDFSKNAYLLEDDESNSYCYPAIIGVKDGFLVAYYHSNGTPVCLNSTKITKALYREIESFSS